MTEPLVYVQTQDRTGRTILSVYNDTEDAERGYVLAYAGPSYGVYVDPQCPPDVAEQIKRLSENELVQDGRVGADTKEGRGMTEAICSVRASELRQLLRATAVASDRFDGYRGLAGVLLSGAVLPDGRSALVATASDRFILVQAHAPSDGLLAGAVFVPIERVQMLVVGLRRVPGDALVSTANSDVTVKAEDFTLTFESRDSSLPKNTAELLGGAAPAESAAVFALWTMKRIAKVAKRMDVDVVRVAVTGKKTPAVVHVGDRCRMLAIPVHRDDLPAVPPVFDPFAAVGSGGDGDGHGQ